MARAKWMGKVGYLLLAAGDTPGDERVGRDEAKLLEFLQSIGITLAPRGGTAGGGVVVVEAFGHARSASIGSAGPAAAWRLRISRRTTGG